MRLAGLTLTAAAVLVLLGSMIAGLTGTPPPESYQVPVSTTAAMEEEEPIRIEVLNGAGITGLAERVTRELRDQGFDVVYYGNAGSLASDSTTILDRSGDPDAARTLARAIGIDRIVTAVDTTLYLEATLVLGPDWEERGPQGTGNRD